MRKSFFILFSLVSVFFIGVSNANTENALMHENIDQFLSETEAIRTNNHSQYLQNLQNLSQISNTLNSTQKCFYEYMVAYGEIFKGNYQNGENNLEELNSNCSNVKVKIRINALLANHFVIKRQYYKAISHLNYIISNIENIEDRTTKHIAYTVSFLVYELINQDELSQKFVDLLLEDSPNQDLRCKALSTKYIILLKSDYDDIHNKEVEKTIYQCREIGEIIFSNLLYTNYIDYQLQISDSKLELNKLLDNLLFINDEIESTKYHNLITIKNSLLAKIYWKLGLRNKAETYAKLTVKKANLQTRNAQIIDAFEILIQLHLSDNNYKKAYNLLIQKNQLEKNYFDGKQEKIMAYQTVQHNDLAKTHQIQSLNQQNNVLKLQNNLVKESQLNQKLIIFCLTLSIGFLVFWVYKSKREQNIYRRLSELDHMTDIYNRKGLRNFMEYLLPYSEKKQEIVSYAIFDLDHFKKINDEFGHVIGDWVIKKVISECKIVKSTNEKITFARIGGEEFAIIVKDTSLNETIDFAEACRRRIEQIDSSESGFDIQIQASFGITTSEKSGFLYSSLMSHADKALYEAKNGGRNRIAVFNSGNNL